MHKVKKDYSDLLEVKIVGYQSEEYHQCVQLRDVELRKPLGLSIYDDDLESEKFQIHFAAIQDNKVVGCVVLVPLKNDVAKLRQMVTDPIVRGKGIGVSLVKAFELYSKANSFKQVQLHARHHACGFYEKLGYHIVGAPFDEVGIEHFKMIKQL